MTLSTPTWTPAHRPSQPQGRSALVALSTFAALSGIVALPASAQYLPLEAGNEWGYVGSGGDTEIHTVTGQIPIFSGNPWVIEWTGNPAVEGLSNFWTSEPDGDVYVWGFYIEGDFGVVYDPPIHYVDAPLELGKVWTQTVDLYTYPDLIFQGPLELAFEVYEDGVLAVPYGEFPSFGIGQTLPPGFLAATGGLDLLGRPVGAETGGSATDWFSFGIGVIQYRSNDLWQLESIGGPVPAQESSWGRIKQTFYGESK